MKHMYSSCCFEKDTVEVITQVNPDEMERMDRTVYSKMPDPEPWIGGPDGVTPATVLSDPTAPRKSIFYSYKAKISKILGIVLLVSAALLVITAGVELILLKSAAIDFWTMRDMIILFAVGMEVPLLITGILAILAARRRTKHLIVATMVMAIIATVFGTFGLMNSLSVFGSEFGKTHLKHLPLNKTDVNTPVSYQHINISNLPEYSYQHISIWNPPEEYKHQLRYVTANQVLFCVLDLVSLVAALWCSTLGCRVVCCNKRLVDRAYVQAQVAYVPQTVGGGTGDQASPDQPVVYLGYNKSANPNATDSGKIHDADPELHRDEERKRDEGANIREGLQR